MEDYKGTHITKHHVNLLFIVVYKQYFFSRWQC